MQYHVEAKNPDVQAVFEEQVVDAGYDLAPEYTAEDDDTLLVSVGGDGSILYNVHQYGEPIILPVRYGDSEGRRCTVEPDEFMDALHAIDDGRYDMHEHQKLSAFDADGNELRNEFSVLNEINLHHATPNKPAHFNFAVDDPYSATDVSVDRAQADGIVVSTPFGSTAYYEVITGESFDDGIGVALNNFDKPRGLPDGIQLSEAGEVTISVCDTDHQNAVLYPDLAEPYEPELGEEITIRYTDQTVNIIAPVL